MKIPHRQIQETKAGLVRASNALWSLEKLSAAKKPETDTRTFRLIEIN